MGQASDEQQMWWMLPTLRLEMVGLHLYNKLRSHRPTMTYRSNALQKQW